jgi:hypothetical protein
MGVAEKRVIACPKVRKAAMTLARTAPWYTSFKKAQVETLAGLPAEERNRFVSKLAEELGLKDSAQADKIVGVLAAIRNDYVFRLVAQATLTTMHRYGLGYARNACTSIMGKEKEMEAIFGGGDSHAKQKYLELGLLVLEKAWVKELGMVYRALGSVGEEDAGGGITTIERNQVADYLGVVACCTPGALAAVSNGIMSITEQVPHVGNVRRIQLAERLADFASSTNDAGVVNRLAETLGTIAGNVDKITFLSYAMLFYNNIKDLDALSEYCRLAAKVEDAGAKMNIAYRLLSDVTQNKDGNRLKMLIRYIETANDPQEMLGLAMDMTADSLPHSVRASA